jgi:hypothetical protein
MRMAYRNDEFHLIKPYGGEEGSGYGEGEGTASGNRINGKVRWANHPRRRSDGRMLPNAGGLVETDDGAEITFLMQGRTVFHTTADGSRVGGQLVWLLFEAADERYQWLNDALCVAEGKFDATANQMQLRVYLCENELVGS